jgi:small-conductance mechanosensitive channel
VDVERRSGLKVLRRVYYLILVAAVVAVLWILTIPAILPEDIREVYLMYFRVVRALTVVIVGIFVLEVVASIISRRFRHLGREVYLIRNVVLVIGYVVLGLMILAIFEVTGMTAVAGATVSGLIIGLGLQPILVNLFAGIIILGTGFLRPGSEIKISGGLPLSAVSFPAYKMFSRDEFIPTLKGVVIEVGLLHTKILSDNGEIVKIPNNMAFSNSIVMQEREEPKTIRVRYEFPVEYDPDIVLAKLQETLSKELKDFRVYVEEQSDKNYYIILVLAKTPPNAKVREYRSKLLKQIIKVHRELIKQK